MNVYNFNYTIYRGYCVLDFYKFALRKHPTLFRFWPRIIVYAFLYLFSRITLARFKQECFGFLKSLKDIDELVEQFWDKHEKKIQPWYKEKHTDSDIVASASPEFLLAPICKRLGIRHLVASNVDKTTGVCIGAECRGEEKLRRLQEAFPELHIQNYYIEPGVDKRIVDISEQVFIVQGEDVIPHEQYKPKKKTVVKSFFLSRAFLAFVALGLINGTTCILLSALLSEFMNANVAFVIGYTLSLLLAYCLNTKFTFCQRMTFKRLLTYYASYIPNFTIQNLCIILFYNTLEISAPVTFTLTAIIAVPITFVILKMFTFNSKKKKPETK